MALSPQFRKKNGVELENTDNFNGLENLALLFANGVYPEILTTFKINTALGDGNPTFTCSARGSADTGETAIAIFWGDNTAITDTNVPTSYSHTYSVGGIYEIGYRGRVNQMSWNTATNTSNEKLIDVLKWEQTGAQQIRASDVFTGADNLVDFTASGYPRQNSSAVLYSMTRVWDNCDIFNGDLSDWDVSAVTTFQETFRRCPAFDNTSIANWVIPPATRVSQMFLNGNFDQDLSNWDMSGVTNFANMFQGGTSNPTGLDSWDTGAATTFGSMFQNNSAFNRDITGWDVSSCTNFRNMFQSANSFVGWDLSQWDVSAGTDFTTMFTGTAAPSSLKNWRFLGASGTFASPFLQSNSAFDADVSEWEMPPVSFATNNMFKFAPAFTGGDMTTKVVNAGLPNQYTAWDMSLNTDMKEMFSMNSNGVFNGDISNWDTGNVLNMQQMFVRCVPFNSDISGWDTANVTDMAVMFQTCSNFNRDISGWNTGNVTTMNNMFGGANSFAFDISVWDVSSVTTMTQFLGASMNFNYGAWNLASIVSIGGFGILTNANCANSMIGWAGKATTNTGATANGIFLNSRVLSKTATVGVDGYDGQDAYNAFLKLVAPTPNANRTSGTNTSTATDKLIDSGATFTASVNIGDVVANTTAGTYSEVVTVDSDTQLTLADDIFTSTSQAYSVDGGFGWALTGTSFT